MADLPDHAVERQQPQAATRNPVVRLRSQCSAVGATGDAMDQRRHKHAVAKEIDRPPDALPDPFAFVQRIGAGAETSTLSAARTRRGGGGGPWLNSNNRPADGG